LLIVINNSNIGKRDVSGIYEKELSILREIRINETLRNDILSIDGALLPIEWEEFEANGLENVKNKITGKIPDYLECEAKLCVLEENCVLDGNTSEEIYVQSVPIVANLGIYSPRQLKLFCWEKITG